MNAPQRDLAVVAVGSLAAFALAAATDSFDRVAAWSRGWERWQVDEMFVAIVVTCILLAWYAVRRSRDEAALRRTLGAGSDTP